MMGKMDWIPTMIKLLKEEVHSPTKSHLQLEELILATSDECSFRKRKTTGNVEV